MTPPTRAIVWMIPAVVFLVALIGLLLSGYERAAGLLSVVGFGGAGIAFIVGRGGLPRRRASVAFGVYMLICGVKFGLDFGVANRPLWLSLFLTAALLLSVVWVMREFRAVGRTAPTDPAA